MCGYTVVHEDGILVCFFVCVCMVTDFSAEDKASGVKFCTAVRLRPTPRQRESPIF